MAMEKAYFDNAATTFPKPQVVYEAMDRFYRQFGSSAGRGIYAGAQEAGLLLADARHLLQKLFHTEQHEAVFTSSATEALNLVLRGCGLCDGDTVYRSPFEHNAVLRPLNHLGSQIHLNIVELAVDRKTLRYDLERISYQFQNQPPRLVVVSHASNVCGVLAPVGELFPLAKQYGALTLVDMAQTAGVEDLNIVDAQADCAVFAGHKTLMGPFGAAGVMIRRSVVLEPLLYGGTGQDSANPDMPAEAPSRYEAGSHNMLAIAGLTAALEWLAGQGTAKVMARENDNKERLIELLGQYDFIRPILADRQIGVVSAVFAGLSSDEAGQILAEQGIAVRTGLHCAPAAHRFLGTFPAGTVRFSVSCLTGEEDFNKLRIALDYIQDEL